MKLKWNNIVAAIFLIAALLIVAHEGKALAAFLGAMRHTSPNHTPEERLTGMVAFGLVGVLLVAIVRLLTANNQQNGDN